VAHPERPAEQAYFETTLKTREARRNALKEGLVSNAVAAGQGNAAVKNHEFEVGSELGPRDGAVAFGRIDMDDGETYYLGRASILDEAKESLVVNWKTRVGGLFYSATRREHEGVIRRRRFKLLDDPTGSYQVNFIEDLADEQLVGAAKLKADRSSPGRRTVSAKPDTKQQVNVPGPTTVSDVAEVEDSPVDEGSFEEPDDFVDEPSDVLLGELARSRSGEMRDIVATIEAAQYELISATADLPLVVQGGPGTGKTAVALHRVSWLLFANRERGWLPGDVLIVGPNRAFSRYIQNVLPALGDQGVAQTDLGRLGPEGVTLGREDPVDVAALKGEQRMLGFLERALRDRVQVPERPHEVVDRSRRIRFEPEMVAGWIEEARPRGWSAGRDHVARQMLEEVRRVLGAGVEPPSRQVVANVLDKVWPRTTPVSFLRELLGSKERLASAAGDDFTAREAASLYRQSADRVSEERFSPTDVPLLDELDDLIGPERVRRFRHVVVDEAQDLSPMQLRSVVRRTTGGSVTLLGDVAQSTGRHPASSWDRVAAPFPEAVLAELSIGYRVPAEIFEFAAELLPRIAPELAPPVAIRRTGATPELFECAPDSLVEFTTDHLVSADRSRSVAVIAPPDLVPEIAARLGDAAVTVRGVDDELGASTTVLAPQQAKGLEFDHVVVVAPERIAESGLIGLRSLYVALTRATQRLTVVHQGDPLAESVEVTWPSADDTPSADATDTAADETPVKESEAASPAVSANSMHSPSTRLGAVISVAASWCVGLDSPFPGVPLFSFVLGPASVMSDLGGDEDLVAAAAVVVTAVAAGIPSSLLERELSPRVAVDVDAARTLLQDVPTADAAGERALQIAVAVAVHKTRLVVADADGLSDGDRSDELNRIGRLIAEAVDRGIAGAAVSETQRLLVSLG